MTMSISFADKHKMIGKNATDILLQYAILNNNVIQNLEGTEVERSKLLFSLRAYLWSKAEIDTSLDDDAFIAAIADCGMITINVDDKNPLDNKGTLQKP